MSAQLTTRQVDEVTVIDVSGRITLGEGTTMLRDELRNLIGTNRRKILLNLADVSYIDSSGIAVLIGAMQSLELEGGTFLLSGAQDGVRMILESAKLDQYFRLFPDVESAAAAP